MDAYYEDTQRFDIRLGSAADAETVRTISEIVGRFPGVDLVDVTGKVLSLEYYPALASEAMIVEAIDQAGIPREQLSEGGFLSRKLEAMAERNRKAFGDGPLDCCDLPKE